MTDDGDYMETGNVIAGSPNVHVELEKIIKPMIAPMIAKSAT